jgi:hypothetical protein
MRGLIRKQAEVAEEALDLLDQRHPELVELGYPSDDNEAQSLGWPCVGAWKGMAARVAAECQSPVSLVPRGSTPATAAAAYRRESAGK